MVRDVSFLQAFSLYTVTFQRFHVVNNMLKYFYVILCQYIFLGLGLFQVNYD